MAIPRKQPFARASTPGGRIPDYPHLPQALAEQDVFLEWDRGQRLWWDDVRTALSDVFGKNDGLSTRITKSITAESGSLRAIIEEDRQARIDGDAALALTISTLAASAGTGNIITVGASAPGTPNIGDMWIDTSSGGFIYKVWSGTAWQAVRDSALTTALADIAANQASISTISSTYATQTFATAKKTEAIAAAAVYTDAVGATKLSIAAFVAEQSATASEREALARTLSQVIASLNDASAAVEIETQARTTADAAEAALRLAVRTDFEAADTALTASVNAVISAYTSADTALASSISTVSASVGTLSTTVSSETSARVAADGAIHAKWGVALDINGNVVGRVNLDGTNQSSEFSVDATKFTVWNGTAPVAPFQVISGQVRVANLTLLNTDVSGLGTLATQNDVAYSALTGTKPPSNADVTLSAINGGLNVTGGGITLSSGGAIKGGATDFLTGIGFFLGYSGSAYKFSVGDPAGAHISWDGSVWSESGVVPVGLAGSFDFGPANITSTSFASQGSVYLSSLPARNRMVLVTGFLEGDSTATTTTVEIRRDSTVLATKDYPVPSFSIVPFSFQTVDTGGAGSFTFYLYGKNSSSGRVISCDGTLTVMQ